MDRTKEQPAPRPARRDVIRGLGTAGLGTLAAGTAPGRVFAQGKAPINISFWTFENPQQRPWIQKRVKLYQEKNPHVKIDFQWFTFGDLGKKISVGYATGTAPDGFVSQDWFMPTWMSKGLLAPLDVQKLGYSDYKSFVDDFAPAFVQGAVANGKVYGYPIWFYGFCNYINTKHFKEVGLDPDKNAPRTWDEFGEVAKRLTIKDGTRFQRQGFKFAMHAAQWTMIQYNPILVMSGGKWFDNAGKCTVNNAAGLKAMMLRASMSKQYGAEDPAESIATNPLPGMDFLKERCSMFWSHPLPLVAIKSQNEAAAAEGYFKPVRYPGVSNNQGISSTYGFNLVVSAKAPPAKQEVLHDLYKFIMADLADCWTDTQPFPLARKSGWIDNPNVKYFPNIGSILEAKDVGVYLPRTVVYNELADAMHRAVQRVVLSNADPQAALNDAAAEVDRATAAQKKGS
jgi:multiple sugar transport system substrate-binding protein